MLKPALCMSYEVRQSTGNGGTWPLSFVLLTYSLDTLLIRFYVKKNLRQSQGSNLFLEIPINDMMYKKDLETKITELFSPKNWTIWDELRRLVSRMPHCLRHPTSNRKCISTIPWQALQLLISKMESYKRCSLLHWLPRNLRGNMKHLSCKRVRGRCTLYSSRGTCKFDVSFI